MKRTLDKRLRKLEADRRKSKLVKLTDEELDAAIDAALQRFVDLCGGLEAAEAELAKSYGAHQAREMMAPLIRTMTRNQGSERS
jgi:hypothetical protein